MKESETFNALAKIECKLFECKKRGVLIVTSNQKEFIDAFFSAIQFEVPVFLGNLNWKENEWNQVFEQINPAIIFGEAPDFELNDEVESNDLKAFEKCIMIPTGGTSGKVRFAIHTWESLCTSAKGTAKFLNKDKINSLCLLPLYHVSGLMQVVRGYVTQGDVLFDPLESFEKDHNFKGFCLSLVPTQLERLMRDSSMIKLLKTFDIIFVGGAATSIKLLEQARVEELPLSPTYGMTETASMVAAMLPKDFLKGKLGVGSPLPHVEILINEQKRITIAGESLFQGYFPEIPHKKKIWITDDEGIIGEGGGLEIFGRADRIIITGGEKVDPKEVEAAILNTGLVKEVIVSSKEDFEWGQKVVARCVLMKGRQELGFIDQIKLSLKEVLLNYKIPKEWIVVNELPVDEKGKIIQIF